MMQEREFPRMEGINGYQIEKRFKSKKNSVYLIKALRDDGILERYVVKKYSNPRSMGWEVKLLEMLYKKGVPVPRLHSMGSDSIIMEFLGCDTLLDILYGNVKGHADHIIDNLCTWLKGFYRAAREASGDQLILGDVNFRNFIVKDKIYGIDFEDCCLGCMEEDAGKICAFSLTYTPPFTERKLAVTRDLSNALVRELCLDRELVMIELERELDAIEKRRGIIIPSGIRDLGFLFLLN